MALDILEYILWIVNSFLAVKANASHLIVIILKPKKFNLTKRAMFYKNTDVTWFCDVPAYFWKIIVPILDFIVLLSIQQFDNICGGLNHLRLIYWMMALYIQTVFQCWKNIQTEEIGL